MSVDKRTWFHYKISNKISRFYRYGKSLTIYFSYHNFISKQFFKDFDQDTQFKTTSFNVSTTSFNV